MSSRLHLFNERVVLTDDSRVLRIETIDHASRTLGLRVSRGKKTVVATIGFERVEYDKVADLWRERE